MECLVALFRPFQEATEILCAEKYVTISFVVPFFDKLRDHLAVKATDNLFNIYSAHKAQYIHNT